MRRRAEYEERWPGLKVWQVEDLSFLVLVSPADQLLVFGGDVDLDVEGDALVHDVLLQVQADGATLPGTPAPRRPRQLR